MEDMPDGVNKVVGGYAINVRISPELQEKLLGEVCRRKENRELDASIKGIVLGLIERDLSEQPSHRKGVKPEIKGKRRRCVLTTQKV